VGWKPPPNPIKEEGRLRRRIEKLREEGKRTCLKGSLYAIRREGGCGGRHPLEECAGELDIIIIRNCAEGWGPTETDLGVDSRCIRYRLSSVRLKGKRGG